MSEDESMRTTQEISTGTHQAEEDMNEAWSADDGVSDGEEGASAAAPRRSDEAIDNNTIGIIGMGGPTEENPQGSGVKPGYEGRARRGASKPPGGYDETPKRRGPRKRTGVRIRYVDDDERGGTTEQGVRMGPVSVWRVVHGHRGDARSAAAPQKDPG